MVAGVSTRALGHIDHSATVPVGPIDPLTAGSVAQDETPQEPRPFRLGCCQHLRDTERHAKTTPPPTRSELHGDTHLLHPDASINFQLWSEQKTTTSR